MNCFRCNQSCRSFSELFSHFRLGHGLPSVGCEVRCTYSSCPRVFLSFQRLKDHALRQHGTAELSQFAEGNVHVAVSNHCLQYEHAAPSFHTAQSLPTYGNSATNIQQSFMRFITSMESKPGISQSMLQSVTEEIYSFVSDVSKCAAETVECLCSELNIAHDDTRVVLAINKLQAVPKMMSDVETTYKRSKWLRENGYLIQPLEIVLGTRQEQQYSSFLRRNRAVIVEDTFQYIPLDRLLAKILEDPEAVQLMTEHRMHSMRNNLKMTDFIDTSEYKNNVFFKSHPFAFLLHFFVDAYETVNVLGSHTTVHKVEALYCLIRNFPTKYLSKTSNIFLIGMWYSLDVRRYGYDKILSPVFKHLQQLESETGLMGIVNGNEFAMHGILIAFSADNLGAHAIFGFFESFSANHPCRFCVIDKADIQEKFMEHALPLRTPENYDDSVKRCCSISYNASSTGIKRGCILNDLKYFHCIEQSVPDCMHDICEGVAPFEIQLVLQSLIDSRIITLAHVNHCIRDFNYALSDRNSKPPEVNLPNMRLQAAECWCLIRNLPLMIGQKVPRENVHWQLLIRLLDCMFIIFAPEVTESMANYLSHLVEEHHALFKSLYPDVSLLPKHHFMVHYGSVMKRFGPLICYWCMRFESKHRFGKEIASVCRNFKNICKTIVLRNQHKLANDLLNRSLFRSLETIGTSTTAYVQSFEDEIANAICLSFGFGNNDEVFVATSCSIGHYSFRPGCFYVHHIVEGTPQFAEILLIISVESKAHFVSRCYRTVDFDEHFYAFIISQTSDISVLPASSMIDCHPLAVHHLNIDGNDKLFINIRAKLF